jgi:hypothetical protein
MKVTENTKIKEWYMTEYPDDELGVEMNKDITFYDLFVVLDTYKSVYDSLGVWDSIIRERVFSKLAEVMRVDYGYIYDQWLKG